MLDNAARKISAEAHDGVSESQLEGICSRRWSGARLALGIFTVGIQQALFQDTRSLRAIICTARDQGCAVRLCSGSERLERAALPRVAHVDPQQHSKMRSAQDPFTNIYTAVQSICRQRMQASKHIYPGRTERGNDR